MWAKRLYRIAPWCVVGGALLLGVAALCGTAEDKVAAISAGSADCVAQRPHVDPMVLRCQCQALGPASPYPICGVDCWDSRTSCGGCNNGCGSGTFRVGVNGLTCPGSGCRPGAHGPEPCGWEAARLIDWQHYAQGEYCGPARTRHVDEYRLRVDDELDLVYRLTREEQPNPYELNVGDEIQVESATDPDLDRNLLIQPDGTITLRLLGQVKATGRTIPRLREEIEELYKKYYKVPAITVSPLRVNSKLDDLRNAVDSRFGPGGQNRSARVTPEGSISLPAIGVVQAQGLTLQELRVELREAYRKEVEGIEVIPVLVNRAPRYVYVLGEVGVPGRYELSGPTTVIQALSMAGGWKIGAHLRQVVVLRRGDDWRLMATMLNLRPPLYGDQPCPPDEIWISDSDVVIVPKNPILVADEFIELVFTRGIYGVFPMTSTLTFTKVSTL
ncbi:MAG TPA: polysaccharide biosynthesis/export family protein [Thermoguttaceae bacterium]|nr:polysaccharide biosynthesis/export family protein [Thermoguttaceae bacterium]